MDERVVEYLTKLWRNVMVATHRSTAITILVATYEAYVVLGKVPELQKPSTLENQYGQVSAYIAELPMGRKKRG